ncbi:MAG TPA: hypothetical protein ENH28_03635 [Euryarchaeota archaeon]|nr:hypothetical protein [Euryarchaeota archaeon]
MQRLKIKTPRKFVNSIDKVRAILSVFEGNEKLPGDEIASRLQERGYRIKKAHLNMFIHYNMLYRYMKKEIINRKVHYSILS